MQTTAITTESLATGTPRNALTRLFNPGPDFSIITKNDEQRTAIEQYIAAKFFKDHGAQISAFMPYLLTMSCANSFSGSVGIRPAENNNLFIEKYLDKHIESYVSAITGNSESRKDIVEIGNLVATQTGASQLIFILLTAVLYNANYQWVAFTATNQVEHILKKLNFTCHTLCAADQKRLGHDSEQWGKYYATNPHVMMINVQEAMEKIQESRLANGAYSIYKNKAEVLAMELPNVSRLITSAL